jgi:hypothetical protein
MLCLCVCFFSMRLILFMSNKFNKIELNANVQSKLGFGYFTIIVIVWPYTHKQTYKTLLTGPILN